MCHVPIGILYIGMAEKMRCFEILKQPYLCDHLTIFTKQKPNCMVKSPLSLYYGKENEENNLKLNAY